MASIMSTIGFGRLPVRAQRAHHAHLRGHLLGKAEDALLVNVFVALFIVDASLREWDGEGGVRAEACRRRRQRSSAHAWRV